MKLKTIFGVLLPIFLLIKSNAVSSASESTEVSMTCKVKTNAAFGIEDGVGKEYSGIQDTFKRGDDLRFTMTSHRGSIDDGIDVTLENALKRKKLIAYVSFSINEENVGSIKVERDRSGFVYDEADKLAVISSAFINIDLGLQNIVLKRYYSGDWNGIYTSRVPIALSVNVATLDCKQNQDKVDDFIKDVIAKTKGN